MANHSHCWFVELSIFDLWGYVKTFKFPLSTYVSPIFIPETRKNIEIYGNFKIFFRFSLTQAKSLDS